MSSEKIRQQARSAATLTTAGVFLSRTARRIRLMASSASNISRPTICSTSRGSFLTVWDSWIAWRSRKMVRSEVFRISALSVAEYPSPVRCSTHARRSWVVRL